MFSHENLKDIRIKKKVSQTEIAKKLNVTRSAYSSWETGRFIPNQKNLEQLANYFDVDVEYFEATHEIVHKYLRLSPFNQEKLMRYSDELYRNELYSYKVHASLSAGIGEWYDETSEYETVYFDKNYSYDIASWVKGDSMEPTYNNGDVALVVKSGFDYDGMIYAVVWDEELFIKKVFVEKNKVRLVSLNKKYKDIVAPIEEVRVVGKVVNHFSPIEV